MKLRFLLLSLVAMFLYTDNLSSQHSDRCGKDEYLETRLKNDPVFAKKFKEWTSMSKTVVDPQSRSVIGCTGANSVVVPVAVHYNAPVTCANFTCLLTMAQAQIDVMNADFGATNADLSFYTSTLNGLCSAAYPLSSAPTGGGSCIQFCLATMNHPAASGLQNGDPAITVGEYTWDTTNGDWSGYLNIFVSSGTTAGIGAGTLGISPFPGSANGDGFFVGHDFFGGPGVSCTSGAAINTDGTYNLGRTGSHEAGHYFGLDHTFSGGCSDSDSNPPGPVAVNDTPAQSAESFGCPNVTGCADAPNSCGGQYTPFYSFMDYTDDACMVMFTEDQSSVINYWGNQLTWASNTTVCGTVSTSLPTPSFTPGTSSISVCSDNLDISFTDTSTGSCGQSITGWSWTFSGAGVSPTSSTSQNPTVSITTSGTLTATLTLTSGATTSSTTTENITVTVLPPTDPTCLTSPCTSWDGGPYSNLLSSSLCYASSQTITAGFEVYANESYLLGTLDADVTYTFQFCNGYSASTWGAEATITIVEYTAVSGTTYTLGSVLDYTVGCNISFTPSAAGNYMAIISTDGGCGGAEIATNNGTPSITATNCYSCGNDFSDKNGNLFQYSNNITDETYVICPDNSNEIVTVTFTEFNLEPNGANCYDDITVYSGNSASGTLIGTYCGTLSDLQSLNDGVFEGSDFGECLTFVFTSDGSTQQSGWFADISCCTCSAQGSNYTSSVCGCPEALNTGGPVPVTMIDNSCMPSSMSLTDIGLSYFNSQSPIENRSVACPIDATSPNQVFFAIQCDSDGVNNETLEIQVTDVSTGGNMDVALYGPVTGGCPNYTGGAFVSGACNSGTGNVTVSTSVNDNEIYLVVISTANQGEISIQSTSNAEALPVELISLNATVEQNNINIAWQTANELNNAGFEILRSLDAKNFDYIAWVESTDYSTDWKSYSYLDSDVKEGKTYYYRLNQKDIDGKSTLSDIVSATLESDNDNINIYPNPVKGSIYVSGLTNLSQSTYLLYDRLGRKILDGQFDNSPKIDLTNVKNGVYHILISEADRSVSKTIIVIE